MACNSGLVLNGEKITRTVPHRYLPIHGTVSYQPNLPLHPEQLSLTPSVPLQFQQTSLQARTQPLVASTPPSIILIHTYPTRAPHQPRTGQQRYCHWSGA